MAPAEVEAALETHPDVTEAAVYGRPDPEWGEAVCAVVGGDRQLEASRAEQLRAHCAARLAGFKVPKAIRLTTEPLPRTAVGQAEAQRDPVSTLAGVESDDLRAQLQRQWDRAGEGWSRRRSEFQKNAAPVSQWMVDAISPQPGHRLLELAAGPGDTGFLAAELVRPGGTLLCSDFSAPMLDAARARAARAGSRQRGVRASSTPNRCRSTPPASTPCCAAGATC